MKRWAWIWPALAGFLISVGLWYWGSNIATERNRLATSLNNRNQRAFYEMVGHVQNVESMLAKGSVSNSPKQRMMMLSDVWQQAFAAQENLSQVPLSGPNYARTSAFLSQTADYTWSLAKKYSRGISPTSAENKRLYDLRRQAGVLSSNLSRIEKDASAGKISWGDIKAVANKKMDITSLADGMQKIDKNMEDFPTIIYDGPFSDHITKRKPLALKGSAVDRKQAETTAQKAANTYMGGNYKVVWVTDVNGTIKAFRVQLNATNNQSQSIFVDVAKVGGRVFSIISPRTGGASKINGEQLRQKASTFLKAVGYTDMVPTYIIEQNKSAIVVFEYKQGDVLIYPDLIKVKVAMDNGTIVGFDATQYLMNHHARNILKPNVTKDTAQNAINPDFKVTSSRLAIIPLEGLKEILAWEFTGTLNGEDFIAYVNTKTGQEEQILQVIHTKGGPVMQ